jgi:heme exporter protein D
MMGDGYFYALSAIAQSFAAIIALNAIFVVYKLQAIAGLHRELLKQARLLWALKQQPMGAGTTFEQYRTESERLTDEYMINWLKEEKGRTDIIERKKKIDDELTNNGILRNSIFYWFKRTLIANGIVVSLSLILLPWRNYFGSRLLNIFVGFMLVLCCVVLFITIHAVLITTGLKGFGFMILSCNKGN